MSANISAILALFPKNGSSATVTTISNSLIVKQHDPLIDPVLLKKLIDDVQQDAPNLWLGKWQKLANDPFDVSYGSQSDADLALAGCIARTCAKEGIPETQLFGAIESVFNHSELAKREKWQNRQDYRTRTISKAMEGIQPYNKLISIDDTYGDIRNARAFAQQWQGKILYVVNAGKWLKWTDQGWSWCNKLEEDNCAKATAGYLFQNAQEVFNTDQDKGKRLMQHAVASHNLPRIQAMIRLAISEPGMATRTNELDNDPWLLGVRNGVVDLRTGALLSNDPGMCITRYCNASHRADANCPQWLEFLDQIFESDTDTIETIQRALGYTLTGSVTEEVMFICFGFGSNGKSVFNNVIANIIGDYGRMAPSSLLTVRRGDDTAPRNDLAALAGARYVSINELQAGDRLDEQIVKQLAGREPISARFLHKEFFEYMPSFKPWLRTNHKPIIPGDDDGIWRRLVLIPFRKKFTDSEKDPYLEQKLLNERDGILMWMIDGALKWKRDGLKLSRAIKAEHANFRTESDLLGEFLTEQCRVDPSGKIEQSQLFNQWCNWCDTNGVRHNAKASFTRRLAERGLKEWKSNGKRFYLGLTMVSG